MNIPQNQDGYELIDIQWDLEPLTENTSLANEVRDDSVQWKSLMADENIVPENKSQEATQLRRQIIQDFWEAIKVAIPDNGERTIYNLALSENIHIVYRSYEEAHTHSAKSMESTKAFLRLVDVLTNARPVARVATKAGDANQKEYSHILIMTYEYEDLGRLKITLGIRRKTSLEGLHEKDLYAITALQDGQKLIYRPKETKTKKHPKK